MPRRTKLGILALLLLLLAGVLKLLESTTPLAMEGWGACLRVGMILGAFWLAYPDLVRLPIWAFPAIGLLCLAAIRWKIFLFAVPPALFLGWLLIPRPAAKNRRQ
jgi:cell division protein FtsW (lipid II flippase)